VVTPDEFHGSEHFEARPRPQVLSLSDAAAERIKHLMAKSGKQGAGLRIGVKNGGCAGMEYTMEFVDEPEKFDESSRTRAPVSLSSPRPYCSCSVRVWTTR
jgi:iron-sulfur cluster assembly protein